ncbi:hypothetical protein [Anaeromyxobacter paludicola]|uniref:Uncharacterized protein n=1 Tax=Anaeromyxobacter paludicola TaxID=2918171 RepID=A0ABM7X5M0_9BACT|nr:hypothetical protein [Anaeromyxobacter paludicola]BDG07102.1 hypothetical protein AMPC_02150 [Anaeromyxobacter paludicola]
MSDLQSVVDFLEEQKRKQVPHFSTVPFDKVLSFMGTTSQPNTYAAVSVHPIVRLEPGASATEMTVELRGALPRPPEPWQCLTVHVTNVSQYQGFQVKTRGNDPGTPASALYEQTPEGHLRVKGSQIFTVHHSPYTMKFFEQIPYDEVQETVGGVRAALVGVGVQANISPRFIYHWELRDGRLQLFHGDGLALKTYMNLKANKRETRTILDLDDYTGLQVRGVVEEFAPHQNPAAFEKISKGFSAGNWGKPSRVFRLDVESVTRIAPAAPL